MLSEFAVVLACLSILLAGASSVAAWQRARAAKRHAAAIRAGYQEAVDECRCLVCGAIHLGQRLFYCPFVGHRDKFSSTACLRCRRPTPYPSK